MAAYENTTYYPITTDISATGISYSSGTDAYALTNDPLDSPNTSTYIDGAFSNSEITFQCSGAPTNHNPKIPVVIAVHIKGITTSGRVCAGVKDHGWGAQNLNINDNGDRTDTRINFTTTANTIYLPVTMPLDAANITTTASIDLSAIDWQIIDDSNDDWRIYNIGILVYDESVFEFLNPDSNGTLQEWTIGSGTGNHWEIVDDYDTSLRATGDYLTKSNINSYTEELGLESVTNTVTAEVGDVVTIMWDTTKSGDIVNWTSTGEGIWLQQSDGTKITDTDRVRYYSTGRGDANSYIWSYLKITQIPSDWNDIEVAFRTDTNGITLYSTQVSLKTSSIITPLIVMWIGDDF